MTKEELDKVRSKIRILINEGIDEENTNLSFSMQNIIPIISIIITNLIMWIIYLIQEEYNNNRAKWKYYNTPGSNKIKLETNFYYYL